MIEEMKELKQKLSAKGLTIGQAAIAINLSRPLLSMYLNNRAKAGMPAHIKQRLNELLNGK